MKDVNQISVITLVDNVAIDTLGLNNSMNVSFIDVNHT